MIDESFLLFKGRLVFQQYIPSKRHQFGVKLFVLCNSETGIVFDIIVYTGTDDNIAKDNAHSVSGAIVKKLIAPHLNRRHILYADNIVLHQF